MDVSKKVGNSEKIQTHDYTGTRNPFSEKILSQDYIVSRNLFLEKIRSQDYSGARTLILEKIRNQDYIGARDLVVESLKGSSRLEHTSEMLSICCILCSMEIASPRYGVDWYRVLQLSSLAKSDTIKARYQTLVSLLQPVKDDIPGTKLALQLVQDAFSVLSDPVKRLAFDTKRNEKVNNSNSEVLCSTSNNLGNKAAPGGAIAGSASGSKRPPHELRGGSGDVQSTENCPSKKQQKICAKEVGWVKDQAKSKDGIGLCSRLKDISRPCSAPLVTKKTPDTVEATNVAARHAEITGTGRAEGSVSTASVSDDEGDDAASSASTLPRWEVLQRRAFLELIKEFVDSLSAQGFDDPASVAKESRNHLNIIHTSALHVGAVKKLLQRIAGLAEELASAKRAAESVGHVDESKIEEAKARLEGLLVASMEKEKEAKAATTRENAVIDHIADLKILLKESRAQLAYMTQQRKLAEAKARTEAEAVSAHRQIVSNMVAHSERVKDQLHALEETKTHLVTRLRSFVKALRKKTL